MKMNSVSNFLICFAVFICCIEGTPLDDLKQQYVNMVMECAEQYPPTPEDLEQLKASGVPESETVKCLIACAFKKTGMMDDRGKLSVDGTNALVEKYFADDPEQIRIGKEFTEACKKVNDEPVSDGDRGCDRAVLLFKCTNDNMPKLGLNT